MREGASDGVPSDTTEDDWSRGSGEDPDLELDQDISGPGRGDELTELDRKVCSEYFIFKNLLQLNSTWIFV